MSKTWQLVLKSEHELCVGLPPGKKIFLGRASFPIPAECQKKCSRKQVSVEIPSSDEACLLKCVGLNPVRFRKGEESNAIFTVLSQGETTALRNGDEFYLAPGCLIQVRSTESESCRKTVMKPPSFKEAVIRHENMAPKRVENGCNPWEISRKLLEEEDEIPAWISKRKRVNDESSSRETRSGGSVEIIGSKRRSFFPRKISEEEPSSSSRPIPDIQPGFEREQNKDTERTDEGRESTPDPGFRFLSASPQFHRIRKERSVETSEEEELPKIEPINGSGLVTPVSGLSPERAPEPLGVTDSPLQNGVISGSGGRAPSCVICLEDEPSLASAELDCGHSFCLACIWKWTCETVGKVPACPLCKVEYLRLQIKVSSRPNEEVHILVSHICESFKARFGRPIVASFPSLEDLTGNNEHSCLCCRLGIQTVLEASLVDFLDSDAVCSDCNVQLSQRRGPGYVPRPASFHSPMFRITNSPLPFVRGINRHLALDPDMATPPSGVRIISARNIPPGLRRGPVRAVNFDLVAQTLRGGEVNSQTPSGSERVEGTGPNLSMFAGLLGNREGSENNEA